MHAGAKRREAQIREMEQVLIRGREDSYQGYERIAAQVRGQVVDYFIIIHSFLALPYVFVKLL
jgi:hypothetical protein